MVVAPVLARLSQSLPVELAERGEKMSGAGYEQLGAPVDHNAAIFERLIWRAY